MKHTIKFEIREIEKKNYHIFLRLSINGKACRLLIDTGASKTVFDAERVLQFVKPAGVKTDESRSVGLGVDGMETGKAILKSIRIGRMEIRKWEVAVLPISHVNVTYDMLQLPPIDGVLGSDFLRKFEAVINYGNSTIRMKK